MSSRASIDGAMVTGAMRVNSLTGAETLDSAANIFRGAGNLTIDYLSGAMNFYYAHENDGDKVEDYAAYGDTFIKSAGAGSVVKLITDKNDNFDTETINGITLPSYRGDIINSPVFSAEARKADPARMLEAYHQSAATLNLLRAFARGGLAALQQVHKWNLGFVKNAGLGTEKFEHLAEQISQALAFMEACGINTKNSPTLRETAFYTSHEALLLPYEEALTRIDSLSGEPYCCSAHMLWIGERTRGLDDAHVHFLSGVKNPIGCKMGPNATADDIIKIANKINPANEAGRFNIIIRMGSQLIGERLPKILEGIKLEDVANNRATLAGFTAQLEDVELEVSDAGIGMTEEQVKHLEEKIAGKLEADGGNGHGIGLKNVQDRIHIAFGERYGLKIYSKEGCYTKVEVRLPIRRRTADLAFLQENVKTT